MKSIAEQYQNWCRHFNGLPLHHEREKRCKANVLYAELVTPGPGWWLRTPCLRSHDTDITCPFQDFPTEEEARVHEEEAKREMAEYVQRVFGERRCPSCDKQYEGKQVERCVYCEHCNARLYQGKVG